MENMFKNYPKYETFSEGIRWPEGQAIPSFSKIENPLDTINTVAFNNETRNLVSVLQGHVNKTKTRVFVDSVKALEEGADTWPERLNIKRRMIGLYELIAKYQSEFNGVVIYNAHNGNPAQSRHYLNLAATVANIKNLLPVDTYTYSYFEQYGIKLDIKVDLRELKFETAEEIYTYMHETYWKDCTKRILFSLCPTDHPAFVRDMAAAVGGAVVWLDPREKNEKKVLDMYLEDMEAGKSICLGWWPEERSGIGEGTHYGISTIPSDYYDNSTVYAAMDHIMRIPTVPKKPKLENKIYIAIFLSDGDNVQYCQHRMSVIWSSHKRGMMPLNWTVSPGLPDIGPQILNYYYDTATENDCFVSGPSGLGYALIYDAHHEHLYLTDEKLTDKYAELSEKYLIKSGLRGITIWDELRDIHFRSYEKHFRSLYGLTLEDWFQKPAPLKLHVENGRLPFVPNYPAYAETTDDIYNHMVKDVKAWDGSAPLFLAGQGVTWSLSPSNIAKLKERLDELHPGKIEFLRADHFFALCAEANKAPINRGISARTKVTASDDTVDPYNTINGSPSGDNKWTSDKSGDKWLKYDLGKVFSFERYVVKHAGLDGMDESLNTKAFTVSASVDGESWTVVDTQENNTQDMTDVDVTPVDAQYIKIDITDAGADGVARVAEVELYCRNK